MHQHINMVTFKSPPRHTFTVVRSIAVARLRCIGDDSFLPVSTTDCGNETTKSETHRCFREKLESELSILALITRLAVARHLHKQHVLGPQA